MFLKVKMDEQRRITLPEEAIEALLLEPGDEINMRIERRIATLWAKKPYCTICTSSEVEFVTDGLCLCKECIKQLFKSEEVRKYILENE